MKQYQKWATASVALIAMGVLAGCGTGGGAGTARTANEANNALINTTNTAKTVGNTASSATNTTANTVGSTSNNTDASMVSVSIPLTNGQPEPSMSFTVPAGWVKQKEGQGDSSGYAWVNPNNTNQQIQLISSGNMSAIENFQTKQFNVMGIFGQSKGVTWTNVSKDQLTANFTDTRGINAFATNEQTPYTGYGKAFVVTQPNPFSVYVEVWGSQSLANSVLPTVHLHQQDTQQTVYVFSQSMLKVMYAVEYFRMVGPIIPPTNIQSEVDKWAPKVSMKMLPYAPASEQALDKQLIENIQGAFQTPPKMTLLNELPGYTLHKDQLPSGQRIYWYPSNDKFPTWADPVLK
ncbi:hypothetical protein [Alicyclobacillus mengziensis]|uniref:Uncharacterized protein n=1 Tax=Alicyclobacillus mengziensis TaxID=2931921 RepID=A0A9X7W0Z2_9BACL|nr:hypothetical protein [Alicyclobacillus mengziensis]QSO48442.1 hypothetical protein JZ786_05490 [Alicyclobacillus mengziensis]